MSINILEFGAVGDGATDCTDALMQAAAYDGTVYFPKGTYIIKRQIDAGNYLRWTGEGSETVIKLTPEIHGEPKFYKNKTVYVTKMLKMENGSIFELHNIKFDADKDAFDRDEYNNGSSRLDHTSCVEVWKADKIILDGCDFTNALIEGVYIQETSDITITRCSFCGNGYRLDDASGLHIFGNFQESPSIRISDCKFFGNGFNGLLLNGIYGAVVNNISCCDNGYDGVALWNGASRCMFSNIFCENNRAGIHFRGDDRGWQRDSVRDYNEERCFSTRNIINGLVTSKNKYGILWGCSRDIILYGWVGSDEYSHCLFYEETETDVTANIFGAVLFPTEGDILDESDNPDRFRAMITYAASEKL